jgi:hypothetical protein
MRRLIAAVLAIAVSGVAGAGPAVARHRHQINATPFAHSPCSVLDNRPCTPTVCSPLDHGPCIPELNYPIGQDLHLTIETKPRDEDAAKYAKPDHDLDTISDLFAALRSCWAAPDAGVARAGMEMSVRFSIKRDGALIAPARLTYATPDASPETRDVYRHAIDDALGRCTPLSLTKGLGGAIAGRPLMVRFVDNRTLDAGNPSAPPDHP